MLPSRWLALVGLLVSAFALSIGVAFRLGRIWQGIGAFQDRLTAVETRHRALADAFHELRIDLAQGEYPEPEMGEAGGKAEPYLHGPAEERGDTSGAEGFDTEETP